MHPTVNGIEAAAKLLENIVKKTPLEYNEFLSEEFGANIYLKREDLQVVRSYKIRGAYNFISNLTDSEREKGIVCASAGNHAQGVALSCKLLKCKGVIFMPATTPKQKVRQVKRLGKELINIKLVGDTYDDAKNTAKEFCQQEHKIFVPPFDHPLIMEGQGTVGKEIWEQFDNTNLDYVFAPIGGGGLISGLATYLKYFDPGIDVIGAEPAGAPAMYEAIKQNKLVELSSIDNFVDGAAIKKVGAHTLEVCKKILSEEIVLVPEGRICTRILQLYNRNAIVAEPAGALSVAALDQYASKIKGKNVVCVLSGGNNDIDRTPDIKERSLLHEGLKHYFLVKFPQRAGALKEFVNDVLGPDDDITLFEYTKKNSKTSGPALVGIELKSKEDYAPLLKRMEQRDVNFTPLMDNPTLFSLLI